MPRAIIAIQVLSLGALAAYVQSRIRDGRTVDSSTYETASLVLWISFFFLAPIALYIAERSRSEFRRALAIEVAIGIACLIAALPTVQ